MFLHSRTMSSFFHSIVKFVKEPLVLLLCLLLLIPAAVLLGLYVNPNNPSFSVEKFYVPAFDTTTNMDPSTIYFNIKLQNQNKGIGLYHDRPVNLTVSYTSIQTNQKFIWQYSVPSFYQGNYHSRRLIDVIQIPEVDVLAWNKSVAAEQVMILHSDAMSSGFEPVVFFRVDITSKVRFKLLGHHGKEVVMSVQVPMNINTGAMFGEKGMDASSASKFTWSGAQVNTVLVISTVCAVFL